MVQKKSVPQKSGEVQRRRGRPRAYDPHTALDRVTEAFWKTGYAGTSLDMLSSAAEMNRPSLYAAFGDKKTAYLKALARYWDAADIAMREALSADRSLQEGLLRVYELALDMYFSGSGRARGCFGIGTATTEAVEEADIRAAFIDGLHRLDAAFEARIRLARKTGEIASSADPVALGVLAAATLHTMAIRARGGTSRAELEKLAKKAVGVMVGK